MPDTVCYTAVVSVHAADWERPHTYRKSFPGFTLEQVQQVAVDRIMVTGRAAKGVFAAAAVIEIDGLEAYKWRGGHWETLGN
jgi:hypothetical protein